jgi:hypothetical protein
MHEFDRRSLLAGAGAAVAATAVGAGPAFARGHGKHKGQ